MLFFLFVPHVGQPKKMKRNEMTRDALSCWGVLRPDAAAVLENEKTRFSSSSKSTSHTLSICYTGWKKKKSCHLRLLMLVRRRENKKSASIMVFPCSGVLQTHNGIVSKMALRLPTSYNHKQAVLVGSQRRCLRNFKQLPADWIRNRRLYSSIYSNIEDKIK